MNTQEQDGETINLQDKLTQPFDFLYSEFGSKALEIVIFDILHPKEIKRGYNFYIIYSGYLSDQPENPLMFHFASKTFYKALRKAFNIFKFKPH